MALKSINLDNRTFQQLVDAAMERARKTCPEWTDMSAGDPGRVLVELFAFITENMLYRLNRLPEKAYIEFLDLLGVRIQPPAAAVVGLEFTRKTPGDSPLEIPRGTRVAAERTGGDPVVFTTADTVKIEKGATTAKARAYHCEWIEAELAGRGTGYPSLSLRLQHPPVIAPTGDGLDLVVGVEATPDEIDATTPVIRHGIKPFRIWQEREGFVDLGVERCVYVADRTSGLIVFAPALQLRDEQGKLADQPAALAQVPREGREIRVWYRSGGGAAGNVASGTLAKLKDPVAGVALEVTNSQPATGGRAAETLEHALRRGPQELHSLRRAVTAHDFEMLARRSSGGVNRAYAYTMFKLWKYAPRGTVELICMPHVPEERYANGPVTRALLETHATAEPLEQVRKALETRRPLGTNLVARWGHCKKVRVSARIVVYREEDAHAVRERLLARLYDTIMPLDRGPEHPGWSFGQPLSAYDVYRILSSEPGVKQVSEIMLHVDEVPAANVAGLSVDGYQPGTWYAAVGGSVYRSLNDGGGWEQVALVADGGEVKFLQAYQPEAAGRTRRAGLIAAIAEYEGGKSRVLLSRDCGESWHEIGARPEFRIADMAWTDRDGEPSLLLATEKGLYALAITEGADPVPIPVDDNDVDLGFTAVAVSTDVWGNTCVAVAAQKRAGVYLSTEGGKPDTFKHVGLKDENIGVLAVQHDGSERYLWAGLAAVGEDPGKGCFRWQLPGSPDGWKGFSDNWKAGGCEALTFVGGDVLAATRRNGVLRLDPKAASSKWSGPDAQSGLPLISLNRMVPVEWLAAMSGGEDTPAGELTIMAAGPKGVYRCRDGGKRYELCSRKEFADQVTLPDTWLFCSDEHDIKVGYDAPRRD
jgi:hypothetical protein